MPFRRGSAGVLSLSLRDESKDLPDLAENAKILSTQISQRMDEGRTYAAKRHKEHKNLTADATEQ